MTARDMAACQERLADEWDRLCAVIDQLLADIRGDLDEFATGGRP